MVLLSCLLVPESHVVVDLISAQTHAGLASSATALEVAARLGLTAHTAEPATSLMLAAGFVAVLKVNRGKSKTIRYGCV